MADYVNLTYPAGYQITIPDSWTEVRRGRYQVALSLPDNGRSEVVIDCFAAQWQYEDAERWLKSLAEDFLNDFIVKSAQCEIVEMRAVYKETDNAASFCSDVKLSNEVCWIMHFMRPRSHQLCFRAYWCGEESELKQIVSPVFTTITII